MPCEKLSSFFELAARDEHVTGMHLVIFTAIWACWQEKNYPVGFYITRRHVRHWAKVSISTYHKCINDLQAWGYIRYEPSYHPRKGSFVSVNVSICGTI